VSFQLQLHTDQLAPKSEMALAAAIRVIYVRDGDVVIRADGQAAGLGADSAWHGSNQGRIAAGTSGAILWRWELLPQRRTPPVSPAGAGVASSVTLSRPVELSESGGYLVRCDRVNFPPGGIAYTHVHRGPGIRRLLEGSLRVEVNGAGHDIAPGEAWFEAGPDPVLATASKTVPSAFTRVMVLPREMLGKPSVRYLRPEDADKPKLQTYRVFVDDPIELP
jgi:hypothetical protein